MRKAWGGCNCMCHTPGINMMHCMSCCEPSKEEYEQYKKEIDATKLLTQVPEVPDKEK